MMVRVGPKNLSRLNRAFVTGLMAGNKSNLLVPFGGEHHWLTRVISLYLKYMQ